MHQNPFSAEASPWSPLGELTSYDAPPDPLVSWRGVPLPISFLPRRFRHLNLVQAPRFLGPIKSSGYAYVVREEGAQIISCRGRAKFEVMPLL